MIVKGKGLKGYSKNQIMKSYNQFALKTLSELAAIFDVQFRCTCYDNIFIRVTMPSARL